MMVESGCGSYDHLGGVSHLQQIIGSPTEVVGVAEVERPEVAEEGLIDLSGGFTRSQDCAKPSSRCQHCMHIRVPQGG